MTDPRQMIVLQRLAALWKERDRSALAAAEARARAAMAEVRQLDAALAGARRTAAETADPATHRTLEGFARWSQERRTCLSERLDTAQRETATAGDRARTSFGRWDVLDQLARAARTRPGPGT